MPSQIKKRQQAGSSVERVYHQLQHLLMTYQFHPGARLNEVELAERLGVSRTPLREVLNRLVAEGLLSFVPNHGFFCRSLEANVIHDLYELRTGLEVMGVKLVIARAHDQEIAQLAAFWHEVARTSAECTTKELVRLDEEFHERLIALSQNTELLNALKQINVRTHFVRWIDLDQTEHRKATYSEHDALLKALQQRNTQACTEIVSTHISRRLEQIVEVIKESIARLYVGEQIDSTISTN